jgi:hypothetical protein
LLDTLHIAKADVVGWSDAPSLASTSPFAIQTASPRCSPSQRTPSRQACRRRGEEPHLRRLHRARRA